MRKIFPSLAIVTLTLGGLCNLAAHSQEQAPPDAKATIGAMADQLQQSAVSLKTVNFSRTAELGELIEQIRQTADVYGYVRPAQIKQLQSYQDQLDRQARMWEMGGMNDRAQVYQQAHDLVAKAVELFSGIEPSEAAPIAAADQDESFPQLTVVLRLDEAAAAKLTNQPAPPTAGICV